MKAPKQRLKIADGLKRLKPDITAEDRRACAKKFKISKVLISYYLNGQVTNNELGLGMIEFFADRISMRNYKIDKLCPAN